jgi:hypothetical protein
MELSRTIGTVALVLGVVLAAGFAVGEDAVPAPKQGTATGIPTATPSITGQMKVQEREAQRRAALEEQQRRKDAYDRACNKPLRSDTDFHLCRTAYKRLQVTITQ